MKVSQVIAYLQQLPADEVILWQMLQQVQIPSARNMMSVEEWAEFVDFEQDGLAELYFDKAWEAAEDYIAEEFADDETEGGE